MIEVSDESMILYACWMALVYVFAANLARTPEEEPRLALHIPLHKAVLIHIAMTMTILLISALYHAYYDPARGFSGTYGGNGALAVCLLPFAACDLWTSGYLNARGTFRLPWDGMMTGVVLFFGAAAASSLMMAFAFWEYFGKIEFWLMLLMTGTMFFLASYGISIIRVIRKKRFLAKQRRPQNIPRTEI